MRVSVRVLLVLSAFAVTAGVASGEEVRVNYNYATTGIGTGEGLWSVTIDSGLIWKGDGYEDPGDPVTFMAPMATPVFQQVDALFDGEVVPGTPGLVGWGNDDTDEGDGFDGGEGKGMYWKFYEPTDTVTLYSITEDYKEYTWDIVTRLAHDENDDTFSNSWYWRAEFADNPDGLDATGKWRPASWFGDVDNAGPDGGHRHSGSNETLELGQDYWFDTEDGFLDSSADGDGIGVALAFRTVNGPDASVFVSNVFFGGDVFADTATIPEPATIALLGLGFVALHRRRRAS